MEDKHPRRYRKLQGLPPPSAVEPPPPPRRWRIKTSDSFKPKGISEIPGEIELRYIQLDHPSIEIKYL